MSRTEFTKSQSHLRNRSSASRFGLGFGSQSQSQLADSSPLVVGKTTPYHVTDADRTKFQSFKFPRSPSTGSSTSTTRTRSPSSSSSPRSFISCDTANVNANVSNIVGLHGLPTPPPSASDSPNSSLSPQTPNSNLNYSPSPIVYPSLPQRFKKQRHIDDSFSAYSTSKNASVDLRNMEETFIEDDSLLTSEDLDPYRGRDSVDSTRSRFDGPGWYSYRWPSSASHSESSSSSSPFREDRVGYSSSNSNSNSKSPGYLHNTFRIKRGVVFRSGLPSTTVMRMLLWGSWAAMGVLIVLAVFFIFKL
ncbi:hypothetical protein GYMLUDRAFT_47765 [Collybiopsis luxurians FD-317 M1]|uniref:Uncharacterized protein n=1 Tax=Collybiopsis luxurians FD-317 M1 TaxID=944289 RepID=A0A0D0BZZ0_9AGAR|nr:hypothetical protein GYMLUDRAFT_47765 [Collybiopsis luxurians FD-317 M1]